MEAIRMTKRKPTENMEDDEAPEAKRRAREEFERRRAENDRVRDEARRHMFSFFKMWTICPDKRCIRTRSCAGDLEECLYGRWHQVIPPEFKALLQKSIANMREGHSAHEAVRLAREDMARREAVIAALDARKRSDETIAAPASPPTAPVTPETHPGPRVRAL
jgi:hypothetical protein